MSDRLKMNIFAANINFDFVAMKIKKLSLIALTLAALFLTSCFKGEEPRTQAIEDAEVSELLLNLQTEGKNVDTAYVNNVAIYFITEEAGNGPTVSYGDSIAIKYEMSKLNLFLIDSSNGRFEDGLWRFRFTQDAAFISGFKEAILLSRKGSRVIFILPSKLAYGAYGALPMINPYEALILGLEVDDIIPPVD